MNSGNLFENSNLCVTIVHAEKSKGFSLNYSSINKKKGAKNIANRYITGS